MNQLLIEKDFSKWLNFSQTSTNINKLYLLLKVLESRQNTNGFELTTENLENDKLYSIKEEYNPTILQLDEENFNKFLNEIKQKVALFKDEIIFKDEKSNNLISKDSVSPIATEVKNNVVDQKPKANSKNKFQINLSLLAYKNKFIHITAYSFVAFLFLQITILRNHLSKTDSSFTNNENLYMFIVVTLVYVFSIWVYNKSFGQFSKRRKIFRSTFLYFFFLVLFLYIEIMLIDIIKGSDRVKHFYVLYFFRVQAIAFIFTILYSIVGYFISGMKMINFDKKNKNAL